MLTFFSFLQTFASLSSISAATIPIYQIPLGKVIEINGHRFVKVGNNDYMAVKRVNRCQLGIPHAPNTHNNTIMQDFSGNDCDDYCNPTSGYTLIAANMIDRRNNQVYEIRKFPDGKCWMVNNLKLGLTTGVMTLTPQDTNIVTAWDLPQVVYPLTGHSYAEPHAYGPAPEDTSGSSGSDTSNTTISNSNFYGYLYNWCAATAGGTASGGVKTCGSYPLYSATTDICPRGWRLPRGGDVGDSKNEFDVLNAKMAGFANNQDADYQSSYSTYYANWEHGGLWQGVLSGSTYLSAWFGRGVEGYYASSTFRLVDIGMADSYAASLMLQTTSVNSGRWWARYSGSGVRCVAD